MNVLMIGPGRGLKGGISSVIESYYEVELDKMIDLYYLETFIDGNKYTKVKFALHALKKFDELVRDKEIIHIHMSSRGSFYRKSLFVLKASKMNKKIILHIHGSEFETFYKEECNELMKKYVRFIFKKCSKVLALSEEWKEILSQIVNKEKIEVLDNSIIVKEDKNKKDYSAKKILFLGRVGKRKGVYDILQVAHKIISKYPDVKFIIAGDGEVDKVKKICIDKEINKNIEIIGWVSGDDKVKLLNEATVYLLPSYNEGMPISILEAMAYKLPIISTNIGGIPQLISNNSEGFIFEPGDLEKLEEVLDKILEDRDLRERLGNNSFNKVNSKFNMEKNILKLCEIYKEC